MNEVGSEFNMVTSREKAKTSFQRILSFAEKQGEKGEKLVKSTVAPVLMGLAPVIDNKLFQQRNLPSPENDFFLTTIAPLAASGYVAIKGGMLMNIATLSLEAATIYLAIENQNLALLQAAASAVIPSAGRIGIGILGKVIGHQERSGV